MEILHAGKLFFFLAKIVDDAIREAFALDNGPRLIFVIHTSFFTTSNPTIIRGLGTIKRSIYGDLFYCLTSLGLLLNEIIVVCRKISEKFSGPRQTGKMDSDRNSRNVWIGSASRIQVLNVSNVAFLQF